MNGVPTLAFRIGHERSSSVIDVLIRVVLTRTEHTREGVLMYRMYDLELVRDRAPALNRAWMVMHTITEKSPLHGATPESFVEDEIEFMLTLRGIDETSGQTLHARHLYTDKQVTWGARYADMLSERQDGVLVLDMNVFHELIPTEPTPSFPHPVSRGTPPLLEVVDSAQGRTRRDAVV
jgi:inward rectifier potassium channel